MQLEELVLQLVQLGEVKFVGVRWLVADDDRRWSSDNSTDALALLSDFAGMYITVIVSVTLIITNGNIYSRVR